MHPVKKPTKSAEVRAIERVRRICLALPGATEKLAWGEPTFRAGKMFAMMDTHHHGADHVAVLVPAELGVQETLVKADPERYFVPPYVGPSGWVGARITGKPDWKAIEELIADAYRLIEAKPKKPRPARASAGRRRGKGSSP
jgi:hypothetical protein